MTGTQEFDESFYATAAQVIPVLLLTLVFQLRLGRRRDDEELGVSLLMLATMLAMALGELSAFTALAEQENLPPVGELSIWLALVGGTMVIAARPILSRWEALHDAIPLWLSLAIRYGLLILVFVLTLLANSGAVDSEVLPVAGAVVVLLFAAAGVVISDFGPLWRRCRRRGEE